MYLQEVKIKNFRGFGENKEQSDRCFVFNKLDSDFVIFYGFNGLGKSSFFEAIEWCLTDTVKRLENYSENYNASELKRSHHLKFYHPVRGNIDDRLIYVELKFSSGLQIIRKSSSISHKFGNEDNYKSELKILKNNKELDEKNLFSEFGVKHENFYQFLSTHFLGQENISSFLRNNSPESRKSIFMKLLSLNNVDATYKEVVDLKSSGKLTRKKTKLSSELTSNDGLLNKIDKYIENHNFKNVDEYLTKINEEFSSLKLLLSSENLENFLSKEIKVYMFSMTEISLEECFNFINKIKKERNELEKIIQKQNKIHSESKSQLELIEVLEHLEKGIKLLEKEDKYIFLKNTNYEKNFNFLKEAKSEKLKHEELLHKSTEKQTKLNLLQALRFDDYINILSNEIESDFWNKTFEFTNDVKKFEEEFSKILIEELSIDYSVLDNFEVQAWNMLKEEYLVLRRNIELISEKIYEKEQSIKNLSNLNNEYAEALNTVKNYVLNNQVEQCPVCLNSDFSDSKYNEVLSNTVQENINQKLVQIMDFTLSKGNSLVEIEIQENEKLILEQKSVNYRIKELISKITSALKQLITKYNEHTTQVSNYLHNSIETSLKHITRCENEEKQLENKIQSLDAISKELFNKETFSNKELLKNIDQLILELQMQIDEWLNNINTNYMNFSSRPKHVEVAQKKQEIKSMLADKNEIPYYNQKLIMIDKVKKELDEIEYLWEIITGMDKVLIYVLPDEFDEKFKNYYEIKNENLSIRKKEKQAVKYEEEITEIYDQLQEIRNEAIENKLKKHPIIGWIYELINPHPFYQELSITNDGRGANFKDESETLYLDHIFSNAQLNMLALSIFLGLGLSVEDDFSQLFLDDPIQSMDDVNILALIDVFRGIMDSKFKNKKLIISTHDSNFAKLLSIKMRNRKIVQYHFKSYNEEGPLVLQL